MPKRRIFRRRHHRRTHIRRDGTLVSASNVRETSYFRNFKSKTIQPRQRLQSSAICETVTIAKPGKITINSGDKFTNLLNGVAGFVDEAEIHFEKDKGIYLSFMDPSRIMLMKVELEGNEIDIPESFKVAVNLKDLAKVLKAKKGEKLTIKGDLVKQKLFLEKKNVGSKAAPVKREIGLIDLNQEEIPMENLSKIEYPTKITLSYSKLEQILNESKPISEIVTFKTNARDGSCKFYSEGTIGESEVSFKDPNYNNRIDSSESGSYSLTFLKNLLKFTSAKDKNIPINFYLKTDHPLKIESDLPEIKGKFQMYLAPRVEEAESEPDEDIDLEF